MKLVSLSEPGAMAMGLRKQRIKLEAELSKLWGTDMVGDNVTTGAASAVHSLSADYYRACELLMRICKVPLAPAGARSTGRLPTPIDLVPESTEIDVPDDRTAPAGDGFD